MQGLGLTGPLASYRRVQLARAHSTPWRPVLWQLGLVFLCGYTIHPNSRALSFAALNARVRNSAREIGPLC